MVARSNVEDDDLRPSLALQPRAIIDTSRTISSRVDMLESKPVCSSGEKAKLEAYELRLANGTTLRLV